MDVSTFSSSSFCIFADFCDFFGDDSVDGGGVAGLCEFEAELIVAGFSVLTLDAALDDSVKSMVARELLAVVEGGVKGNSGNRNFGVKGE